MEDRDAEEFVLVLRGYYRLFTDRDLFVDLEKDMWIQKTGICKYSISVIFDFHYVNITNVL